MKHIFMINRFSLRDRLDKYVNAINKAAKKLKLDYKIEVNSDYKTTEDILEKYRNKKDIIYAVGGDGILNRVVNAVYKTKNKIACIPAGTGNDFNRSINQFFKSGDNLVDLIKCNDKYFVNAACFGIDADIGNDESIIHNKLIPKPLQYKVGVLKHFVLYKPYNYLMKWNNESKSIRLSAVTVCNGGYYGGGFHVNADGIYNDGMMDVYIVSATNRRQLLDYVLKLLKGKHKDSKFVEHVRTNNFTIITEKEINGNLDGESLKSSKFEMKIIPNALTFYHNIELLNQINKELGKK